MAAYTELHCHSCYSLREGASTPEELVLRARELLRLGPRQPFDGHQPLDLTEVAVAGDDGGRLSLGERSREAVGKAYTMESLEVGCCQGQRSVYVDHMDCVRLDVRENLLRPLESALTDRPVDNLSKIDGSHHEPDFACIGATEKAGHSISSRLVPKEGEESKAIKDVGLAASHQALGRCGGGGRSRSSRSNSQRLSARSPSVIDGPPLSKPRPEAMGSSGIGMMAMVPPKSTICTLSPGRMPWRSRMSRGITTQPFLETLVAAIFCSSIIP